VHVGARGQRAPDDQCEQHSIDRAMTALILKDTATATAQYGAGSNCAAANARLASQLPKLAARDPRSVEGLRDLHRTSGAQIPEDALCHS
jgi:hypothetical protein